MGRLKFRILGPLEVTHGDRLIDLGGPQPRAAMALLLIHANRVLSVDGMIEGLWGEHPPAHAAGRLQVVVSTLRRALEPDRSPRAPAEVLVTCPPGYMLRVDPADLDASQFEALVAEGRQRLAGHQPERARGAFDEALALWRGPALAEVAFQDFAQAEASRLGELHDLAVEGRVQADLDLGRHAATVPELERLTRSHPLREGLWALLMVAYYRSGRQAEALRAYQQARHHLGEELGIEPSPALRRLEQDVLEQAPSLDWHPSRDEPKPAEPSPWPTVAGDDIAVVGRAEPLRQLDAAVGDAVKGQGGVVLISGEAGVGKTRLAEEVATRAARAGAVVVWGRCQEGDATLPFWPWIQVLRALKGSVDLVTGDSDVALAFKHLLPELRERNDPRRDVAGDPHEARLRMFQAISDVVLGVASERCVVMILDDLQWADVPSLHLLGSLTAEPAAHRLLVLALYRDVDVDADHPLVSTLAALARRRSVTRMNLVGLTEADVAPFIATVAGVEASPDLAAAVHSRTDGNPFYMTELLRLLATEGSLGGGAHDAALGSSIPAGVTDVIRQRLAQLPDTTRDLLVIAAVGGREFDGRLLERVSGVDGDEVLTGLELALARGIVTEADEAVGRYRFSHALVRETVYEGLSRVRRARLHAAVGDALELLRADDPQVGSAELAYHYLRALPVGDPAKAWRYAMDAAGEAMAQLAWEGAEAQLRQALAVVPSLDPDARAPAELRTQASLGSLLASTTGHAAPETERAFARAAVLGRATGDTQGRLTALWGLFYSLYVQGRLGDAEAVAHELLVLAEERDDPSVGLAAHLATGICDFHRGELGPAAEHFAASVEVADRQSDPALVSLFQTDPRVYARCFSALVTGLQGRAADADAVARQARDIAGAAGYPLGVATATMFSAWLGVVLRDAGMAREQATTTLAVSTQHGFRLLAAIADILLGWARAEEGDVHAGRPQAEGGLDAMRVRAAHVPPFFLGVVAETRRLAGDAAAALRLVDEAQTEVERLGGRHYYQGELSRIRARIEKPR